MLYANVHYFSFATIILPLCISAYILDVQGPFPNQNLMVQQEEVLKFLAWSENQVNGSQAALSSSAITFCADSAKAVNVASGRPVAVSSAATPTYF